MFGRWRDRFIVRQLHITPDDGLLIATPGDLTDEEVERVSQRGRALLARIKHGGAVVLVNAPVGLMVVPGAAQWGQA